ncbi:MAG: AAA domain-containing protein [Pseudoclavibacter sp.]|nr:AAA domain-containing protein [Pseudoclavibacter sp.]
MIDRERHLVILPDRGSGEPADRSGEVECATADPSRCEVEIRFANGWKSYCYGHPKARLLAAVERFELAEGEELVIGGGRWRFPADITVFADVLDPSFVRTRVRAGGPGQEVEQLYPGRQWARHEAGPAGTEAGRAEDAEEEVLGAWRRALAGLGDDDPLRIAFERMTRVHPDSVLALYLRGRNGPAAFPPGPVVLPFRSNEEQREAIATALAHRLSVVDGPPGTGKTETILNLIANVLLVPGRTIGVVSFGNAAVDNVRDKLVDSGIGFVAARLGSHERVAAFLQAQDEREEVLQAWLAQPPPLPPVAPPPAFGTDGADGAGAAGQPHPAEDLAERVAASERRLREVWRGSRRRAEVRNLIEGYTLESAHLERRTAGERLPELSDLPLLRKDSGRILDYLAETALQPRPKGGIGGLVTRLRRYLRYGRLGELDPGDAAVVLRLERAFYAARLAELREEEHRLSATLERLDAETVRREHETLSRALLDRALRARRPTGPARRFQSGAQISRRTSTFLAEYPVLLTTCHSIRRNLAEGALLDWLVIDEATMTSLPAAALAMSRARNLVVVGDMQQLGHILPAGAATSPSPRMPAYDVVRHSILSSVIERYGERLPRTMLREHFRCARPIIEFCNRMYYGGRLVPCTSAEPRPGRAVMRVRKTAPGNHDRKLTRGPVTGRYNQREIDEILDGVLEVAGIEGERHDLDANGDYLLGVTTPYRLQADRLDTAIRGLPEDRAQHRWLAETVHKFQGRGAREIVLSTVVGDSREGRAGLRFVDDPRLVNVAVSRAKERFTLVTHHGESPRSTHIRALIDYIRFQDPEQIVEGEVLSVFDLLYSEYSERLARFAKRVRGDSGFLSENIVQTLLGDILADPDYARLAAAPRVRLRDLLPDTGRLDERQRSFVRSVSAVDFAVYHRVSRRLLLAIEVDGTAFHENDPEQQRRDRMKASILRRYGVEVLSLPTNGSGEEARIRAALDRALAGG